MRLRVTDAGERHEIDLDRDRLVLGRLETCDVVLADTGVSREHAALERDGDGWWIADLGSRNRTFVNDEEVERARIAPGDRVRLGPGVTLELLGAPVTTTAAPRARATTRAAEPDAVAAPVRAPRAAAAGPLAWFHETHWRLHPRAAGGRPHTLRGGVTTVGRDPGAGLVLDDESASRMHARIDREGTALYVTDLKSRNGTHVNGEPVLRAPLGAGDTVRFGDVEFRVTREGAPAWGRIGALVGAVAALVLLAFGASRVAEGLHERAEVEGTTERVRAQALEATRDGIAASRAGEADLARAHLLYAADLLLLSDLAPRGSTLAQPEEVFRDVKPRLASEDRDFDFARALDPATIEAAQAKLNTLTNPEYVERQVRRFSVELGQDDKVPPGFVEQVSGFVQDYNRYHGSMQAMLKRARDIQPRIRGILAQHHLPEAFCYVAWVESGLDPTQRSPVGALGLWQLMPDIAREKGLRVDPSNPANDERTNVERSTAAAADYFAQLLRDQGPEYFMLVLASYNRGHNALDRAKQKIDDPMLRSSRKYWYLVDNHLLPEETRNYVPKIFAVRIVAEAPERFGYQP